MTNDNKSSMFDTSTQEAFTENSINWINLKKNLGQIYSDTEILETPNFVQVFFQPKDSDEPC
jgi:hypothetical protein